MFLAWQGIGIGISFFCKKKKNVGGTSKKGVSPRTCRNSPRTQKPSIGWRGGEGNEKQNWRTQKRFFKMPLLLQYWTLKINMKLHCFLKNHHPGHTQDADLPRLPRTHTKLSPRTCPGRGPIGSYRGEVEMAPKKLHRGFAGDFFSHNSHTSDKKNKYMDGINTECMKRKWENKNILKL